MLKARGCGVAFNSDAEIRRKLAALMYADDVVLLAASKEELQTMIDVVHEFCNKWRIEVNTKKSQVMVVHPSEEHRARDQGASWTFGDTQLEVVDQYKYLGVIFSNDLTWTKQSLRVISKAKASLLRLSTLLSRKELPSALKTLVWDSVAGSVLQYGTEVWDVPTLKLKKQLESIQHQARIKMFRLQRHSSLLAVRGLAGARSLASQRLKAKLRYRQRLLAMGDNRLTKQIVQTPGPQGSLRSLTGPTIRSDKALRKEFKHLSEVLGKHCNPLNDLYAELGRKILVSTSQAAWERELERFMSETDMAELQDSITTTRSQARLIARSYTGAHRLSPRQASRGTGVQFAIRRRLLVGSAAVNSLMSTISPDRSAGCLCGAAEETVEHFLLECDIYDDLRENLLDVEAPGECGCKGGRPCLEQYCGLDDLGKCVFLLGGPVGNLAPCGGVDACLDSLVNKMWVKRGKELEKIHGVLGQKRRRKRGPQRPRGNSIGRGAASSVPQVQILSPSSSSSSSQSSSSSTSNSCKRVRRSGDIRSFFVRRTQGVARAIPREVLHAPHNPPSQPHHGLVGSATSVTNFADSGLCSSLAPSDIIGGRLALPRPPRGGVEAHVESDKLS